MLLEGPVSLGVWKGKNGRGASIQIDLLADMHKRVDHCVKTKEAVVWSVMDFIRTAHQAIPNEFIDLFIEYTVPNGSLSTNKLKINRGDEKGASAEHGFLFSDLFRELSPCLFTDDAGRKECLIDNMKYRVHQVDIRQF